MADLATIKPSEITLDIVHPANDELKVGLRIGLLSMTDPRMKKVRRKILDEKLRRESKGKNFKAEEIEENQNELILNAMTSWEWYNPTGKIGDKGFDADADLTFHGQKPEFTRKNVFDVLNELEWVAEQISEAISDEKRFFS